MIIDPKICLDENRKMFNRKRKSSFHIRGNKTLIGGKHESSNFRSREGEIWVIIFPLHAFTKYLIGRSYKNHEFDWLFLFPDCIMHVIEL